jgi:hypothetical protein
MALLAFTLRLGSSPRYIEAYTDGKVDLYSGVDQSAYRRVCLIGGDEGDNFGGTVGTQSDVGIFQVELEPRMFTKEEGGDGKSYRKLSLLPQSRPPWDHVRKTWQIR